MVEFFVTAKRCLRFIWESLLVLERFIDKFRTTYSVKPKTIYPTAAVAFDVDSVVKFAASAMYKVRGV